MAVDLKALVAVGGVFLLAAGTMIPVMLAGRLLRLPGLGCRISEIVPRLLLAFHCLREMLARTGHLSDLPEVVATGGEKGFSAVEGPRGLPNRPPAPSPEIW